MVGRVADRAVQIFGGAGYIADYGIERLYRDVRLFRIYEGTSQIQQTGHRPRDDQARRLEIPLSRLQGRGLGRGRPASAGAPQRIAGPTPRPLPQAGGRGGRRAMDTTQPLPPRRPHRARHRRVARYRQDDRRGLHRAGRDRLYLARARPRPVSRPPPELGENCIALPLDVSTVAGCKALAAAARRAQRRSSTSSSTMPAPPGASRSTMFPEKRLGQGDGPQRQIALLPHPGAPPGAQGGGEPRRARPR